MSKVCKEGRCEAMLSDGEGEHCKIHREKTLLEKAQEYKPRVQQTRKITNEDVELLIAYLKKDIQQAAVAYTLYGSSKSTTNIYSFMIKVVFEAIEQGRIILPK